LRGESENPPKRYGGRFYTGNMSTIDSTQIHGFINHWLKCPNNGYLGSGYGQDIKALLQRPQADGSADDYLAKLREDVLVLQVLPAGSTNLYGMYTTPDKMSLFIEVAGTTFNVPEAK
jgi:hypothetical protein